MHKVIISDDVTPSVDQLFTLFVVHDLEPGFLEVPEAKNVDSKLNDCSRNVESKAQNNNSKLK